MRKVKQITRIVLWIALGICFALGAWFLRPAAKQAFADEGDPAVKKEDHIVGFHVIGWAYGSFKSDSNFVRGQASSGAEITYTISCDKPVKVGAVVNDVTFTWADLQYEYGTLNELPAGDYTATATTRETSEYFAATATVQFKIRPASNSWTIYPYMFSWATNDFNVELNLPAAGALHGEVELFLTRQKNVNDATVEKLYTRRITRVLNGPDGYYVSQAVEGDTNVLNKLPSGTYYLQARVAASEGEHEGLSCTVPVMVFQGSDSRPENYWQEIPSMHSYTSEYQTPSAPKGATLRWTDMRYEYYRAVEEGDDFVVPEDATTVCVQTKRNNGTPTETVSGEMPVAPGWYIVRMTATYREGGEIVEEDTRSYDVPFQVREAINEWTQTPHIANWYLSNEASEPEEGKTTYLSEVSFMYKKAGTDNSTAVAQKPTEAGDYVMLATARALLSLINNVPTYSQYCKSVTTEVPFKVSLRTNTLIAASIASWSEEFAPSDPIVEAAAAGDVTYTYYRADGTQLDGRPEEAGDYYLIVTVDAEGYETLESPKLDFTITPAWDETFLIIDIVLTVVASVLTVVVIIFAKRRLSQC